MSETEPNTESPTTVTRPLSVTVTADVLQPTVDLVHSLVDECRFSFTADGLRISAVDPAMVASVELGIDRDAFDAYEADDCRLGIDLERFSDIVGMAAGDRLVELAFDPERSALEIGIGELSYTLGLLDPDSIRAGHDHSEFDLDLPGEVVTTVGELERAVRTADMISDHLVLGIDGDDEVFSVEADGDTDRLSLELPSSTLDELVAKDAESVFSVDYLEPVCRAIPTGSEIALEFGTETPIAIRSDFADGAGTVEYLVSPRIPTQ